MYIYIYIYTERERERMYNIMYYNVRIYIYNVIKYDMKITMRDEHDELSVVQQTEHVQGNKDLIMILT